MPCGLIETFYDAYEGDQVKSETLKVLLCSACRVLSRLGYDFDENPALSCWWDTHQEEDKKK